MSFARLLSTLGFLVTCCAPSFCQFGIPIPIHSNGVKVSLRTFQVSDLNNDGIDDVVLDILGGIMYSLGNGDGTFATPQYIDSLSGAFGQLYVGDVTGDGLPDMLYDEGDGAGNTYIVLREGDGSLDFGPEQQILLLYGDCVRFEVGDLDNDGDPDLAFAMAAFAPPSNHFYSLQWSENLGGSVWGSPATIEGTPGYVADVALVDIDNDGDKDVVSSGDGFVHVWRGDGGGDFTLMGSLVSDSNFYRECIGVDMDGDGDKDIVARNDHGAEIFLNAGSGTFTSTTASPDLAALAGNQHYMVAGDLDSDGDMDLISDTRWFSNDGSGIFDSVPLWPTSLNGISTTDIMSKDAVALIDINGDGALDLLVSPFDCGLDLFVNPGTGPVGPPIDVEPEVITDERDLVGADIDLDGRPDAIVSCWGRGLTWYRALANGGFDGPRTICRPEGYPLYISCLDMDNDGDTDVVYFDNARGRVMLARNDGSGGFSTPTDISSFEDNATGDDLSFLADADLDGDGDLDLVTKRPYGSWYWHPNDGATNFGDSTLLLANSPPNENSVFVDLNNDGAADLVSMEMVNYHGQVGLPTYMNDGAGNLAAQDTIPLSGLADHGSATFYDVDQDGNQDLVLSGGILPSTPKISWIRNEGNGNWSSPITILSDPDHLNAIEHLHFTDADGDGVTDLLFDREMYSTNDSLRLQIMNGLGGGNFDLPRTVHAELNTTFNSTYFSKAYTAAVLNPVPPLDLLLQIKDRAYWIGNFSNTPYQMNGHVFHDTNANSILDPGEQPMPLVQVHFEPAAEGAFSYSNGQYVLYAQEGTYTVNPTTLLDPSLWQPTTPTSYEVALTASDPVSQSNDFGYEAVVDTSNIQMEIIPPVGPCAGYASFWFNYDNEGTRIENGTVAIHFSPQLMPQSWSFSPAPTLVQDTTFYWGMVDLGYLEHRSIHGIVTVPSLDFSGDTISIAVDILVEDATGTVVDTTSSLMAWLQGCAYDPNDKAVSPKGFGEDGAVPIATDHLTYTVRFQNTGTGTAYNVLLQDQIPDGLDIGSMELIGFSHQPTQATIDANRLLTVRFLNIMLPDSGNDFANSQGFITFRLKVEEGLPHLTQISNTAEIYFDSNPPIVTNTTLNTLVDCNLWQPVIDNPLPDLLQAPEGFSYQWLRNDEPIFGAVERWLTISSVGNYTVTVTSEYGCTATSGTYSVITLAVAESDLNSLIAMPNPFNAGTTLYSPTPITADQTVLISDMEGLLIRSVNGNGSRHLEIPKAELAAGMYTVRLISERGATQSTLRLVVE